MGNEERLKILGLTTLETRRLRGDLIEVFKILKGYENIDQEVFFDMSQSSFRGHSLKLNKKRVRRDVAKFSFSHRVVNEWNRLDEAMAMSPKIFGCRTTSFRYVPEYIFLCFFHFLSTKDLAPFCIHSPQKPVLN